MREFLPLGYNQKNAMSSLKDKSILIVEQEASVREALIQAFQFNGASVVPATNGESALEALKTRKVDFIYSELETLGENYDILRLLHQKLKLRIPVFLSTSGSTYSLDVLKKLGVIEVFRKPVEVDRVIQAIRDEIAKKSGEGAAPRAVPDKVTFLVVQEEVSQIEVVSNFIATEYPNAGIIGAMSPKTGLQKLGRQKFDLVISDINLGRLSGLNFIREVALDPTLGSNLKFILTGDGPAPEELQALPGKVIYCPKPLEKGFFLDSVRKLVILQPDDGISAPVKVDVEFINPFIDATLKVFGSVLGVDPVKEAIFLRQSGKPSGDISGVLEMNSERFFASMAISFEKESFLHLISRMMGKNHSEVSPDVGVGLAELCNQIFGGAKSLLDERGYALVSATPSIQVGNGHSVKHTARGACIAIRFSTELGFFTIEAVLEPRKPQA